MRKTWAGKLLAMVLTGVTVMGPCRHMQCLLKKRSRELLIM